MYVIRRTIINYYTTYRFSNVIYYLSNHKYVAIYFTTLELTSNIQTNYLNKSTIFVLIAHATLIENYLTAFNEELNSTSNQC